MTLERAHVGFGPSQSNRPDAVVGSRTVQWIGAGKSVAG